MDNNANSINSYSPNDDKSWVHVVVYALGETKNDPKSLVLLLVPKGAEDIEISDSRFVFFPLVVSPQLSPIFFHVLTNLNHEPSLWHKDIGYYYELMGKCSLRYVAISHSRERLHCDLYYSNVDGNIINVAVPLDTSILTAIKHSLPIYIEESLLKYNALSKVHFSQAIRDNGESNRPFAEIVSKCLRNRKTPEEVGLSSDLLKEGFYKLTNEESEQLLKFAISSEQYEWALIIKECIVDDER